MSNEIAIYDFQEFLLKSIAPKYFDIEDSSLLRVGILGYVNELFATNVESNAFRMSELADEFLPSTAKLKSSIYRYASFVKYDDLYAIPAKAPIALMLKESDILRVSNVVGDRREFILDKYMTIKIGQYPFMIPYDIRITIHDTISGTNYLAEYIIDDGNPNSINSYIPVQLAKSETLDNYLYVMMECSQVERIRMEEYAGANTEVERMKFNFDFVGDMASFKIYYAEPDSNKFELLESVMEYGVPSDTKFCYYYYEHDDKYNSSTLNISFSDKIGDFIPERGGKILLDIYTSEGDKGNFNYRGKNASILISDTRFNYDGIVFNANILADSIGGKKSKSLEEISDSVKSAMVTINSINTDRDLNFFFRSHYDGEINFVKKREDIIRRVYAAFCKLNAKDMLISSNTLNLIFNSNDINPGGTIKNISSSQSIVYRDETTTKRAKFKSESDTDVDFEYFNPFTHVVDMERYSTKTFLPSIKNFTRIVPKYTNRNTVLHPLSSEIGIFRNALDSDSYSISMEVSVSDFNYMMNSGKIYLVLEDSYIKMNMSEGENRRIKLNCEIKTNDLFDSEGQLRIVNSLSSRGELIPDRGLPISNLNMGIYFFLPESDIQGEIKGMEYMGIFENELDLVGYTLSTIYSGVDPFNIALDISDLVRPIVSYFKNINGLGYDIEVRGIPLLRMDYRDDPDILMEIYNDIYNYNRNIKSFKDLLDNHDVSLKFINTYGRTNVFRYQDGRLMESNNITMRFNISLHSYLGINLDDLKYEIQTYLAKYVENLNMDDPTSYSIYISNIIRFLERDFTRIKYIEFLGINSTGPETQVIEFKETPFEELEYDYIDDNIPEYLNVGYKYIKDRNIYEPNIEITFK